MLFETLGQALEIVSIVVGSVRIIHVVAFAIVYVIYRVAYQLAYPYRFSPLRGVPGPPLGSVLVGHAVTLIRGNPSSAEIDWAKQYGPVLRVVGPFGLERLVFLKPEALHQILVADWLDFPRPTYLRYLLGLITGHGLLTVTGDEHKQMRKAMNPAFSIPNLVAQTDMYYDSIYGLVDILKAEIESEPDLSQSKGKQFLMYQWMSKVTLDIICETAFGYKSDSLHNPHNELAEAYENLINTQSGKNIAYLIMLMLIPGIPRLLDTDWVYNHQHWLRRIPLFGTAATLVDSMHRIKRVSAQMLRVKMAEAASVTSADTLAKRDIMSLLVRARLADAERSAGQGTTEYTMSDKAMMSQVLTFLGAGHETMASGLAWTLWLLAKHPEAQAALREEVCPVVTDTPRPHYRALKELEWLDCVVMESLRLMPPVPMTPRIATKTTVVDGVTVPKGTLLHIPIRVVNTWAETWGPDSLEFRPARWRSLPKAHRGNLSMLSFIAGPHACIGKTMAVVEMKAVLAVLIAHFEFTPAYAGQIAQPTAAITMKPKDGMPLRVRCVPQKQIV